MRALQSQLPYLTVACFVTSLSLLGGGKILNAKEAERPDIVFVLLDDLRWDALSYLGHPYIETPNIDRLRAQGAHMANAFVTTSICCPSRATFLTGTYASRHGVIDNETSEYDPQQTPPLTRYLQEAGYRTAMIGKWHMGYSGHPRPHFDEWLSFDGQGKYYDPEFIYTDGSREKLQGYTTDILTDRAIEFIERQNLGEPYFLMLSHKAVHEPFQPAPRHEAAYGANVRDPEPVSWSDTFEGKPKWQRRQRVRDVRWNWRTGDIERETLPARIAPEPWEERSKYVKQLRCLAAVDDGVGRIMETLQARGTLENTLIVFTSDNGYFHMEHRRWDKRLAYEESMRIPMVVVYPGRIQPASTVTEMVTNLDFAPTVLAYAGLEVPADMQGQSMQTLFEGNPSGWREQVFYEYWTDLVHAIPTMRAVRGKRYKLIDYPMLDEIDELYDLHVDPHEMNNLVEDPAHAEIYAEMQQHLERESAQVGWRDDVFPLNLPRVRGPEGILMHLAAEKGEVVDFMQRDRALELSGVRVRDKAFEFNGRTSSIRIPFDPQMEPSGWPYRIQLNLKAESDGVIATQATPGYGFKIFVEDGRPGIAVMCKTWVASRSIIDGKQSILNEWTELEALIDYNRLSFWVNGELVERLALPLPFKAKAKAPLIIGVGSANKVSEDVPNKGFKGEIRSLVVKR